jgi:hypothetical protein
MAGGAEPGPPGAEGGSAIPAGVNRGERQSSVRESSVTRMVLPSKVPGERDGGIRSLGAMVDVVSLVVWAGDIEGTRAAASNRPTPLATDRAIER